MLHPRNAAANALAERVVWTAVHELPDAPVVEAVTAQVVRLHETGTISEEQFLELCAGAGSLDTRVFAETGDLDPIVRQLGRSLAGMHEDLPMDMLQRLVAVFQEPPDGAVLRTSQADLTRESEERGRGRRD